MSDKKPDPVSKDSRFSGVYSDPKFKETKAKSYKIKLDDRFSKKDLEFKRKAQIDKYGRPIDKKNSDAKDFDKYFDKEKDFKDVESENDAARGEAVLEYVSSSDEESSSDSDVESLADSDVQSEMKFEQNSPETGDATKTLAVVNLDWDNVRCVDLMIAFSSFVPPGGKILQIHIYPSKFGKERMRHEEMEGPPREIFECKKTKKKHGDDYDEDGDDFNIKNLYEEGDAQKDYNSSALRRYQLDRLRYYYAIVECNNVETAEAIYKNCDGTEYESTANIFDLRYVPDGMEFDDEYRDKCDTIPSNYEPIQFSTFALQHSQVKLTWDETPADRVEMAKRAFTQKEIDDMDFKAYLASDSDDSDSEINQNIKNKLKLLAEDGFKICEKSIINGGTDQKNKDLDMEITFTPGLESGDMPVSGTTTTDVKELSTIEKIKLKEKDRRKRRKERVKELKKQSEENQKAQRKTSPITDIELSKKKAELELLMLDDKNNTDPKTNAKSHFNMKEIIRSEKEGSKKKKYQDKRKIVQDNFKPDLNDPRFKELFEDHDFAIDPSKPEFKQTSIMKEILKERRKRSNDTQKKRKLVESHDDKSKLSDLVTKLKSKTKRIKNHSQNI